MAKKTKAPKQGRPRGAPKVSLSTRVSPEACALVDKIAAATGEPITVVVDRAIFALAESLEVKP